MSPATPREPKQPRSDPSPAGVRLVRYLAQCGVASRRAAAGLVQGGVVEVNGSPTTNVALAVKPQDEVRVRGKVVKAHSRPLVLMLNKPPGLVCSRHDPHNPETVLDLLPPGQRERLKPVGRLDKQSTGLLLLTDDGDLAFRLTHPRYGVEKTYRVTVDGPIAADAMRSLRAGVQLEDGLTAPARLRPLDRVPKVDRSTFDITLHEGRKRQVRRMFQAVGARVLTLERVQYGPLKLTGLKCGETRPLKHSEIKALRAAVGL